MSASMQYVRGRSAKNMRQLQSKIADLQTQYQQHEKCRQEEIVQLLSWVDLTPVDNSILMGAFLFIQNKITTKDPIMEVWQSTGMRFLRQPKSKSLLPFTLDAASQKANRSPQKQLESREK